MRITVLVELPNSPARVLVEATRGRLANDLHGWAPATVTVEDAVELSPADADDLARALHTAAREALDIDNGHRRPA